MLLTTVITYIYFLRTQANTYKSNKAPGHNISVEIVSYNGLYVDYDHSLFGYDIIENENNKFIITAPLINFIGNKDESQRNYQLGEVFDCEMSKRISGGSFAMRCFKKAGLIDFLINVAIDDHPKLLLTKLDILKLSSTDVILCSFTHNRETQTLILCLIFNEKIHNSIIRKEKTYKDDFIDLQTIDKSVFARYSAKITLWWPPNLGFNIEDVVIGKYILDRTTNTITNKHIPVLYFFLSRAEGYSQGIYRCFRNKYKNRILDLTNHLSEPSHHFAFNALSFKFKKIHYFVFSNPYAHQNKGEIVFFVRYDRLAGRDLNIIVGDYYGDHYGFSVCRLNQIIKGTKELVILVLAPYGGRFRNGAIHMYAARTKYGIEDQVLQVVLNYLYKIELSDYFSDIDGIDTIACRIFNSDINSDGQDDILISTTSKWLSIKTIINSRVVSISYDFTWTLYKDTECDKAIENYVCVQLQIEMYFDTLFDEIFDNIRTNFEIEVPITIKFPLGYLQSIPIKNDGDNLNSMTVPTQFRMITEENKFKSTAVVDLYLKRNIFGLQVIRQRKMDAHLDMDRFFNFTVKDQIETNYHILSINHHNNKFESVIQICDLIRCLLGGKASFHVGPTVGFGAKIDKNIMVTVSGTLPLPNNDDTKPYLLSIHWIFNEKYLQFLNCNGTQIQLSQSTKQNQVGMVNVKMILLITGPEYNCKFKIIKQIRNENVVWQKITVHMFTLENSDGPIKILSAEYSVNPTLDIHYALNRFTYTNNFNMYGSNSLSIGNRNEIEVQIFGPSIFNDIVLNVKVSTDSNNKLAYIHQYQCLDVVKPTILCKQDDCAFEKSMEFNCPIPPENKFAHTKVSFVIKIREDALNLVKFNNSHMVYVNAQIELNRDITYIGEPLSYAITLENKQKIKEVYNVIPTVTTVCPEVKLKLKGWAIAVVFASAVFMLMIVFITLYHFDFLKKFIFTPSMLRLRADAKKQANIIIL